MPDAPRMLTINFSQDEDGGWRADALVDAEDLPPPQVVAALLRAIADQLEEKTK